MLILTRRIGETTMIGDDVVVTVLGVSGNQVAPLASKPQKQSRSIAGKSTTGSRRAARKENEGEARQSQAKKGARRRPLPVIGRRRGARSILIG